MADETLIDDNVKNEPTSKLKELHDLLLDYSINLIRSGQGKASDVSNAIKVYQAGIINDLKEVKSSTNFIGDVTPIIESMPFKDKQ